MKASMSVPAEAVSIYNNALDLTNKGAYLPALDEYKKALEIFPKFIEAYNNIGEIYSKLGDSDSAISNYMEALSIERSSRVLLNLGVEYYNEGHYEAALKHFNEAVSVNDDFLEGHFYAGMANFNLKKMKKAEMHFSRVTQMDAMHLKANYLLSYIYYEWKQYQKTLDRLEIIKDFADDKAFVNRYYGFCLYHLGRFEEAVDYLQAALKSSPKYKKFRKYLEGLTYENKVKEIGDVQEKIKDMEAKIINEENKPSLGEYTHLSMLYIFNGEYEKAEKLLESAKLH